MGTAELIGQNGKNILGGGGVPAMDKHPIPRGSSDTSSWLHAMESGVLITHRPRL